MTIAPLSVLDKDPNSTLDYEWDWSGWLASGDSLASGTVLVPSGLTLQSISCSSPYMIGWLAGGIVGTLYQVTCRVWTAQGRTEDSSIFIRVEEK